MIRMVFLNKSVFLDVARIIIHVFIIRIMQGKGGDLFKRASGAPIILYRSLQISKEECYHECTKIMISIHKVHGKR